MWGDEHPRHFDMRLHLRFVDQAEFNSCIVQNNKMNHYLGFYYIVKSDVRYYKVQTTLAHFKEEMANFISVRLWLVTFFK